MYGAERVHVAEPTLDLNKDHNRIWNTAFLVYIWRLNEPELFPIETSILFSSQWAPPGFFPGMSQFSKGGAARKFAYNLAFKIILYFRIILYNIMKKFSL
jgi:hypothetical protein